MKQITREVRKFLKGKKYHLDTFIDIQAFVSDYMEPYRCEEVSENNYDPDLTDNFICTKSITIKITKTLFL